MEQHNLTAKQFAELLGFKVSRVRGWLNGTRLPNNMFTLIQIAEKLDVTVHWLVTGEEWLPLV